MKQQFDEIAKQLLNNYNKDLLNRANCIAVVEDKEIPLFMRQGTSYPPNTYIPFGQFEDILREQNWKKLLGSNSHISIAEYERRLEKMINDFLVFNAPDVIHDRIELWNYNYLDVFAIGESLCWNWEPIKFAIEKTFYKDSNINLNDIQTWPTKIQIE